MQPGMKLSANIRLMNSFEPVLHVAECPQQAQAGFAQVQVGVERFLIVLALVDAGLLLGFGCELRRRSGTSATAVAKLKLSLHGLQLFVGDLLFQAGNFGLGVKFAQRAVERGNLDVVLLLSLLGLDLCAQCFGGRLLGLVARAPIEQRDADRKSGAEVVGRQAAARSTC